MASRKYRLSNLGRHLKERSLHLGLGLFAGLATLGLSGSSLIRSDTTVGVPVQAQEAIAPFAESSGQSKHHNTLRRMSELRQGQQKWLEINLNTQRLIAWEGGKPVYAIIVSTGKPSTPTYSGVYSIYRKQHPERMRGRGYDIPNVPHAMYYHRGYAIHGAFWHSRFGTPVSHGCTNVAPNHARWLYNWASVGTPVVVHR
ncbi:MAG: L,D-transpeptidase [Cyanobacteria bacterium P01_D01_bin.73]